MKIFKPPYNFRDEDLRLSKRIFLAGSIENGTAEDWQEVATNKLKEIEAEGSVSFAIFNPRRTSWDASWEQSINNPLFKEQVDWELDALDAADIIFMYFSPNTKSPISLLELGLFATSKKMIVCCPDGFWRKGNVEVVCKRFDIPLFNNLNHAMEKLISMNNKSI